MKVLTSDKVSSSTWVFDTTGIGGVKCKVEKNDLLPLIDKQRWTNNYLLNSYFNITKIIDTHFVYSQVLSIVRCVDKPYLKQHFSYLKDKP
jgi:hypothetical protein